LRTLKALKIVIFLVGRLSGLGGWPVDPSNECRPKVLAWSVLDLEATTFSVTKSCILKNVCKKKKYTFLLIMRIEA
jgi:hypothetical protein